jgi:hypothetical protein
LRFRRLKALPDLVLVCQKINDELQRARQSKNKRVGTYLGERILVLNYLTRKPVRQKNVPDQENRAV